MLTLTKGTGNTFISKKVYRFFLNKWSSFFHTLILLGFKSE